MRSALLLGARAVLLAGPTALAFFSGGFFERGRLTAAIVAWLLVLVVAVAAATVLPRSRPGLMALGGLALLAAWTAISQAWAPLRDPAFADLQRVTLYLGTLVAAIALLRERVAGRWLEPVLALGAVVLAGYGLSDRLLPGVVTLARTASAGGRLDQPLTYWNAMGLAMALGLVVAARLAGDRTRPPPLRIAAGAASPLLGAALYLTFSRGALAALAAGLIVLLVAAPERPQARAVALVVAAGVLAAVAVSLFGGVEAYRGDLATRRAQGAAVAGILVVLGIAAAVAMRWACDAEAAGRLGVGAFRLPVRPALLAVVAIAAVATAFVVGAANDRRSPSPRPGGANPARLSSISTNRYEYWRVAVRAFAHHPLRGVGAAGFRTEWLRHRPFRESVRDAHSLYLETAAELGLVGLAALALLFGGVAIAARDAWRRDPVLTAGWLALLAAWALHAGIDWDWEMPAVTLPALVAAGALLATAERHGARGTRTS